MAKYLYITGILKHEGGFNGDGEWCPTFRHAFVDAKDDDEAYTKGSDLIDDQLGDDEELAFNDLVIKIP